MVPAVGGSSSNVAFNPGTYKGTGTQYGTSRAPLYFGSEEGDPNDDITAYTLEDILYPDVKAVAKARQRVKNAKARQRVKKIKRKQEPNLNQISIALYDFGRIIKVIYKG